MHDEERVDRLARQGKISPAEAHEIEEALADDPQHCYGSIEYRYEQSWVAGLVVTIFFGVSLLGPMGLLLITALITPRFQVMFEDLGVQLPTISQWVLTLSHHTGALMIGTVVYAAVVLVLISRKQLAGAAALVTTSLIGTLITFVGILASLFLPLLHLVRSL